jgi:branched-chain amino acid transport system substrate-binding protein
MTARKRWGTLGALLALAGLVAATVGTGIGGSTTNAQAPIVIGWAFDSKGNMAPFDGPALAAAKVRIGQINAKGGVGGRPLKLETCDTNNNNPAKAKSCAASLLGKGADIMFTTCDVDFATPVVQESLKAGKLTIAPCIGTDQMGPKRFGGLGKLAFSYGNVAQDEGAAMAEYAYNVKHWTTAITVTDNIIVYFKNIVQAFTSRYKQLGGKIVDAESFTSFDKTIGNVVSRVNGQKADVIVTSTGFSDWPTFMAGIRSLNNQTPIMNSWAGDGTFWYPKSPPVSNYWYVTYASVFGDDPSAAVKKMIGQLTRLKQPPATGGFVTGAASIDGIAAAIKLAKGSTNGPVLAAIMQKFRGLPTISGKVSFSPKLHSVFGRAYRVMEVQNSKPKFVQLYTAKTLGTL